MTITRGHISTADVRALRERFERDLRALAATAKATGVVATQDLEQLDDLHKLLTYAEGLPRRQSTVRALTAALVLFLLSVVSLALFHHRSRCRVDLDLTASRVAFQVDQDQALFDSLAVARLELRPASRVDIVPATRINADASLQPVSTPAGAITLGAFLLRAGTRVDLDGCAPSRLCAIRLAGQEVAIGGSIRGKFLLDTTSDQRTLDFPAARGLRLIGDPSGFTIAATLVSGEAWPPLTNLHVHGFTLDHLSEHPTSAGGYARIVSTLQQGKILFPDLPGLARILRPREPIKIDLDGWIDELTFADGALRLLASGTASRLELPGGEDQQNLMPTDLEWWRQHHGLSLLWGSTAYLLTLALAVKRWWQGEPARQ